MDEPNWTAVEPGVIVLPTTGYEIAHDMVTGTFLVSWMGRRITEARTLAYAKSEARRHMCEIIAVGREP